MEETRPHPASDPTTETATPAAEPPALATAAPTNSNRRRRGRTITVRGNSGISIDSGDQIYDSGAIEEGARVIGMFGALTGPSEYSRHLSQLDWISKHLPPMDWKTFHICPALPQAYDILKENAPLIDSLSVSLSVSLFVHSKNRSL